MRPLTLTKSRSSEYEALAKIGVEKLTSIQADLSKTSENFLKLEQLSAFLAAFLDEKDAVRVSYMTISLRRLADRYERAPGEVLDSLTEGMKAFGWSEELLSKWALVRPPFQKILSDKKIELLTKASDLYYRDAHHIHEMKIITDLRPVLNEERDKLDASIIKNTFFLQYSDADEGEKSLELAIGYGEIKRLRDELDRAIKKTDLLKRIAETNLVVPVMIYDRDW